MSAPDIIHHGDIGDLAAPGAYAILIGTPEHVPDSELPALPAVATTLDDLEAALNDACGMRGRVHRVPPDARQGEIVAAVERAVREATGPILLCYVGHGILGPGDELYLATRASRSPRRIADAVPYGTVRNLLTEAPGGSVVVLDCCYSGRAQAPGGQTQGPPPFVVTRPDGSFLLSSASWYDLSYAPEGHRHTLFGGRLIGLLTEGDPAGSPWLTLDGLHEALDRAFHGEPIRPWRQSEGTLGSLRLTRNRAYADPHPQPGPPAEVPCPYPGMEPFGTPEARHFFGREELTRRLLDAVCDDRRAPQRGDTAPVVLVGGSGVGKSSLLTAGLLAGLERRRAEPSARDGLPWPPVLLPAPGPHPLRALAEVWARATGRPPNEVHRALAEGRLPEPLPGRESHRLLVVDQFEEVFTRCTDAKERSRFIDVLTRPEGTAEPPRVVLGLRADHYGSCLTHPGLARALDHGQFTVRPMDDDALRAAVERPARAVGLTLEPGLTDRLLHDLRHGDAGHDRDAALPFLAHALRETWLRRSGATLTLAGYEATGGIWRAVTTTTDGLYDALAPAERGPLRELLFRLVHLTDDGVAVRRRVPVDDLLDGLSAPQQIATRSVRERLAAARLITVDQEYAQIAHEALLHAWPRLRTWIEEDRDLLVQRQKLADSAREWEAGGRHGDLLLQGIRLDAAVDLLRAERLRHRRLPRTEEALVHASLAADRKRREGLRRRVRVLVSLLCALAVVAGVAVWQTVEADRQRGEAQDQRRLTTLRALIAESRNLRDENPRLSLRLALAAHRIQPSTESRAAVFGTLAQARYAGSSTDERLAGAHLSVLSRDGRMQADARSDGIVLWDVSDAARRRQFATLKGCGEYVAGLAFSANGRTLAGACDNGSVVLWSLADRKHPRRTAVLTVDGLMGDPSGVAFSPDGKLLAAAGWGDGKGVPASDRSVVLWSLSGDEPRQVALERGVYDNSAVLFSPDGRTLVSSTDRIQAREEPADRNSITHTSGTTLWDISTPARPRRLTRLDRIHKAAFSPDGRLLATSSYDEVILWDVAEPARPKARTSWPAHKEDVTSLAFDRSGTRLATASRDNSVTVWDVENSAKPKQKVTLRGHEREPQDVVFGEDTVTSVSAKEVVRWSVDVPGRPEVLATIGDPGGATEAAAITPDGRTMALAGYGQTVTLWSMADPSRPKRIGSVDVGAFLQDLAISADGSTLAAADRRNRITLWDITAPARPRKLSVIDPIGKRDSVHEMHLDFSPRGATLVANGGKLFTSGWAALWDVTDPERPKDLGSFKEGVDPLGSAEFSPDGELLSLPSVNDTYLVRYRSPSAEPIPLSDAYAGSTFSPDGKLLATTLASKLVFLDISSPEKPRKIAEAPDEEGDYGEDPVFHPDGSLLATTTEYGDVRLIDVGDLSQLHTAATLSFAEQLTMLAFSRDGRLAITYRDDGPVLIWDLHALPAISADPIGRACRLAGGGLREDHWSTPVEDKWSTYAPGLPYQDSCPEHGKS